MKRPGSRPYRATVYLPGHDEAGHGVPVARVSAASEAGLARALKRWHDDGYTSVAWEEVPLDLEGDPCPATDPKPDYAEDEGPRSPNDLA